MSRGNDCFHTVTIAICDPSSRVCVCVCVRAQFVFLCGVIGCLNLDG